jgi:hypothetical protein
MKANELRIGNLVNSTLLNECRKIDAWALSVIEQGNYQNSHNTTITVFEPIPITKEWLLKFGFKHQYKTNIGQDFFDCSIDSEFQLYVNLNDSMVSINKKYVGNVYSKKIQYVHQLQNIYFALTGEELTIKGVTND